MLHETSLRSLWQQNGQVQIMEKTVTRVEIQKKNKKRVSVYIDDHYAFALSVFAAARLSMGQTLTDEAIETLKREDRDERAYDAAVRFLGYRARSVKEMRVYLREKKYPKPCRERVIARLEEQAYLNEKEFARLWIENRRRLNPKGAWMLKQELLQKGVAEDLIDEALATYDEEAGASDALIPKLRQWKKLDEDALKKKIYTFLSQRGFSYDTTRDVTERVMAGEQLQDLWND